jgi:2-amino-4-hydroxy-6-hydroxymethyldihydropteridine diphosphokinase
LTVDRKGIRAVDVLLSIGSNLGDRTGNLRAGVLRLVGRGALEVSAVSSLYASDPVDAEGGEFLNAVVAGRSALDPQALLAALKQAERDAGRTGTGHDPRPLDLDVLYLGQARQRTASLVVPHPRRFERPFVLVPLAEVCGSLIDPETGRPVGDEVASRLPSALRSVRRVAGPEWWL